MRNKRVFVLVDNLIRQRCHDAINETPLGYVVEIKEKNRTLDQNAAQWPILEAFSEQLLWPVNGQMVTMTADEWKDVLTAAFRNETSRLAMGLDGGVVMLGMRTSKMTKKEFSNWLEFLNFVAADRGVNVSPLRNKI